MENLALDLRFALRNLARRPGFTALAILTLALGIGADAALFSVIRGVLLRPFPFHEPERLVIAWETQLERGLPKMFAAPPNFADWEREAHSFAGMAAFRPASFLLSGDDRTTEIRGAAATASLFEVLGVRAEVGRIYTAAEDRPGAEPVVVLGHDLWRRSFGADPRVLGRTVELDGGPRRIIGVMPAGFAFPPPIALEGTAPAEKTELWVPLASDLAGGQRGAHFLTVVARLADGVALDRAEADLQAVAAALADEHPGSNRGWSAAVVPLTEEVLGRIGRALWLLLGAVGLVLLIACINLANLLLAQSAERQAELSVRRSLGASGARLARQLVTEGLALSLLGGTAGLFLAWSGLELLVGLAPANVPRLDEVAIDPAVVAFALALSVGTGLLFSALPALGSAGRERSGALLPGGARATAGPGASRLGGALVVAEVALAMAVLVGAGLFGRSFLRLQAMDPGFAPEQVLTAQVTLPPELAAGGPEDRRAAWSRTLGRLEAELAAVPGVEGAGFVLELPLDADRQGTTVALEGREAPAPGEEAQANFTFVTPGYLRAMGVPLLAGRGFEDRDRDGSEPVVLVNRAFVRRLLPEAVLDGAVGEHAVVGVNQEPWRIVGVVGDVRHDALGREPIPAVYLPYHQLPWSRSMALAVRTALPPERAAGVIRDRLRVVEPEAALYRVRPMAEVVAASAAEPRFSTLLLGAFAAAALALAALGVYGVLAHSVRRRTREIGVRVALGAARDDVLRLVLGRGMGLVGVGIVLGLGLSLLLGGVLSRSLASAFVFEASATDPATTAAVAGFLAAVGLVACYLPARRAMAVDPREALAPE
jgi:putative ABC transport system permease protein